VKLHGFEIGRREGDGPILCRRCDEPLDAHIPEAARTPRPVSDPSETLALISEHRLTVRPRGPREQGWLADETYGANNAVGSTIGEAVRACVERIRNGQ
jgi:hypothetical protein